MPESKGREENLCDVVIRKVAAVNAKVLRQHSNALHFVIVVDFALRIAVSRTFYLSKWH